MRPFSYEQAIGLESTLDRLHRDTGIALLAGGTTLVDLMKLGVTSPERVIDITTLASSETALASITPTAAGGVQIGALAKMSDVAGHPLIADHYPGVAQALLKGASAQLRNMASIGGNLLQRTRCVYFRDVTVPECNKRNPGSGCAARLGVHRQSAVLGASEACIALHPSDLAVPLVALEATIHLRSRDGGRAVAADDFFLLPGDTPQRETALAPGEMVVAVELPPLPDGTRSCYLKARDRESYEFALASAAAAVQLSSGTIRWARAALGGVATVPWRAREAEHMLTGHAPSANLFAAAAEAALTRAVPLAHNEYKIPLARATLATALATAAGFPVEERSWPA
jgi:xanthine dehydrogenase YagS FAD-binding subunit